MPIDRRLRRRPPVPLAVFASLVVACGSSVSPAPSGSPGNTVPSIVPSATPIPSANPPIGGTLRVGLPHEGERAAITGLYIDPHRWFGMEEVLRCCLVRTLLSYNGRLTADGGAVLRPDLAETLPDVSADGLTWTFHLKPGLRYGPPYEDTEIAARDVIRGVERSIALGEIPFLDSIVGAAAYRDRQATTVSGLEAPDKRTLVVRLDRPDGDIATALALPAASPIPQGVTDGHPDDYGRFLVASGPYMYEGSEGLMKGGVGEPLDAGQPAGSGVLLRNPSWDRATDALRGAWVDRIEFSRSASLEDDRTRFASGGVDIPSYEIKPIELPTVRNDPAQRDRIAFASYPRLWFVPMNMALAPFDSVHVRRA
ncbi:MAG TPA: ABC transporter substrate-binding protein, partial [Candidatus Limnocylindrales bacterium]|nr:ABC transporter substrate-binding protein [Candidatus Limnocylindrales bacterium]